MIYGHIAITVCVYIYVAAHNVVTVICSLLQIRARRVLESSMIVFLRIDFFGQVCNFRWREQYLEVSTQHQLIKTAGTAVATATVPAITAATDQLDSFYMPYE